MKLPNQLEDPFNTLRVNVREARKCSKCNQNWELGRKNLGIWENRQRNVGIWEFGFLWELGIQVVKTGNLGIKAVKTGNLGIEFLWELRIID